MKYKKKYGISVSKVKKWIEWVIFEKTYKDEKWMIPKEEVDGKTLEELEEISLAKRKEQLVGKSFGGLTILDVLGEKEENGESKQKRLFVEIGCECGGIVEMPFYNIERGAIKYCNNQCPAKSGFEIGQTIHNLTIIKDLGIHRSGKSRGKRMVKTVCRCGEERDVFLIKLKSGDVKSCSKNCKMNLMDVVGNKYNYLTVIRELQGEELEGKTRRHFLCECDCGEKAVKELSKLISGYTKFCSHSCILQKGEGSPSWKPDKTWEERLKGRDYFEYKNWRKKVYERDDFTCQCCDKRGGEIAAHHKDGYNWCKEKERI